MPAPYAHLKISDNALVSFFSNDKLSPDLRSYAEEYSGYIHMGSVAPDYPYLDFAHPKQKIWADHMHYDRDRRDGQHHGRHAGRTS